MNFYKKFYQKHPYLNVLISLTMASLIGIAIEYLLIEISLALDSIQQHF